MNAPTFPLEVGVAVTGAVLVAVNARQLLTGEPSA